MALPRKLNWDIAQDRWAAQIDPVLALPQNSSLILKNVALTTGANTINHKLGRKLQGWSIIRIRSAATIYDTQDSNQSPDLTLTLNASANVNVDIEVF